MCVLLNTQNLSTVYQLFPYIIHFRVTSNNLSKCYYKFHLLGGLAKVPDGLLLHCTKTILYTIAHSAHGLPAHL